MTDYYLVMYKREIKSFVAFHMLNFNNKKQNSKALFLIFVTIFVIIINGCASQKEQISKFNWVKYSGNPIIYEGKKGEWNQMMGDPFVMRDESMYKMWFGANMPICRYNCVTVESSTRVTLKSESCDNWTRYDVAVAVEFH